MTVLSFELIDADGEGDNKAMRSYKTHWQAITDNVNDHALTVLSSPLMPNRPNSPYSVGNDIDLLAYAHKARARRREVKSKRTLWDVFIDFTTKPSRESNSANEAFTNPVDKPITFGGEFVERSVRVTRDLNGIEVRNSAGDRLPLEVDAPLFRLQITKNMPTFDVPQWKQYARKAANLDVFWDSPLATVLCAGIRPQIEYWGGGNPYYPTTFDFLFLEPTPTMLNWDFVELRDEGPMYWSGGQLGQGKKVHFRDDEGLQFANGTGDLDGQGGALAAGANPQYRSTRVKDLLPFAALGLPTSNPFA